MRYCIALLALALLSERAHALEIWLARTGQCNTCGIYERVAQRRGYGDALQYGADSGGERIPIRSIDKSALASGVIAQLPADVGPKDPNWNLTLTVLVMDAGRVLTAGNIADSADNHELRHSHAVMFPPAEPADDDPALHDENLYSTFFSTHWNLEYFVDVAKSRAPARDTRPLIDLAAPDPLTLGAANVILWGSAGTPLGNPMFIPTRIGEIRAAVEGMKLDGLRFVTLFGHGPDVAGNDTSHIVDGRTRFRRAAIDADLGADAASLNRVLTAALRTEAAHTLLVQVGHSGPVGSPLWGHGLTLTPENLAPLREAAGSVVMVSGACHGGQFAEAVQCGFFAAHPDVIAAGCQKSSAALDASDDYLRHFFRAATGAAQPRRRGRAPAPTLADAHWDAVPRLERHQIAYTTTDARIDAYFASHPDALPASLTVTEVIQGASSLGRAEFTAAKALTAGLAADTAIPLTGYIEANHAADRRLADATELSSTQRNAMTALPYRLMLPPLARRVAYTALGVDDAAFVAAASCEKQSLRSFLKPTRGVRKTPGPRRTADVRVQDNAHSPL